MPYKLDGNCVVKADTGETVKCHDTHEQALAHLRALEANVSEAKQYNSKGQEVVKQATVFTQAQVKYVTLSAKPGQACANCIFYRSTGFDAIDWPHCHIVENYPEPIEPTGYCNEWRDKPEPPPEMTEAIVEAVEGAVETVMDTMMESMPMEGKDKTKPLSLVQKLRALLPSKVQHDSAFTVFKGSDNEWHWHAIFTNNYEDLEGEILTEKAHDNYIARLDMQLVPMPELWAWHTPGTRHGEADMVWRNEHFVHAIGHFDETPLAQKAIAFYRKNVGKIKMSHGFTAPEWAFDGKHYKDYNTIEITTLPPHAAANPYTSFEELKTMALSEEKRRYIEALAGKDKVAEIEAADEQRVKTLEELKVAYKDYADATPTEHKDIEDTPARKAYMDLVASQSEQLEVIKLMAKALEAEKAKGVEREQRFDKETAAWQKEIDALKATVNAPIRRPSQDASTTVTDEEKKILKDKLPSGKDGFWESMGVALKDGGSS